MHSGGAAVSTIEVWPNKEILISVQSTQQFEGTHMQQRVIKPVVPHASAAY